MQTIQWENLGVSELAPSELERVSGGDWPLSFKSITWLGVATAVAENWGQVKQGFIDGWNAFDSL